MNSESDKIGSESSPQIAVDLLSNILLTCGFIIAGGAQLFAAETWLSSPLWIRFPAAIGFGFALISAVFCVFALSRLYNLVRNIELNDADRLAERKEHRHRIAVAVRAAVTALLVAIILLLGAFGARVTFSPVERARHLDRVQVHAGQDGLRISIPAARVGCLTVRPSNTELRISQSGEPC